MPNQKSQSRKLPKKCRIKNAYRLLLRSPYKSFSCSFSTQYFLQNKSALPSGVTTRSLNVFKYHTTLLIKTHIKHKSEYMRCELISEWFLWAFNLTENVFLINVESSVRRPSERKSPCICDSLFFAGLTFREVANTNVNWWVWPRVANTGASSIAKSIKNVSVFKMESEIKNKCNADCFPYHFFEHLVW